jgi:integrase
MRRPDPPYCISKRGKYSARLTIPADVRYAFAGKRQFLVPLRETGRSRAAAKAAPLVAEWQQRIAAARAHQPDPLQETINQLAEEFRSTHPDEHASAVLVSKVANFIFQRVGGLAALEQHRLLQAARGDLPAALAAIPAEHRSQAANALRQITGEAETPFLTHLDRWIAAQRKTKITNQYAKIVREFAGSVDQPIERLTFPRVQGWIDSLLQDGKAPNTVRFRLQACKGYWGWMQDRGLAPTDRNPFSGRRIKSQQSAAERVEGGRNRFDPLDVPRLWEEAERYGDFDLFAAIKLSAYMGWRLEEVCQLRCECVRTDRASGIYHIYGGLKTEAGIRSIPVHPDIRDVVQQLAQRKDSDGYLIRFAGSNKWNRRGNAIGQRFSKMKRRMGYGRSRTFHSLRYTYAYLLAKGRVPMHRIKDLMGHKGRDVTEGYIGDSDLDELAEWVALAIRFDAPSFSTRDHHLESGGA